MIEFDREIKVNIFLEDIRFFMFVCNQRREDVLGFNFEKLGRDGKNSKIDYEGEVNGIEKLEENGVIKKQRKICFNKEGEIIGILCYFEVKKIGEAVI